MKTLNTKNDESKLLYKNWHFLPELPETNKKVLIAIKYDSEPSTAYWTGREWKTSLLNSNVRGGEFVENYSYLVDLIYAWAELPQAPISYTL